MNHVEIRLNEAGRGTVKLDGHEIHVSALEIVYDVHKPGLLAVKFTLPYASVDFDADVLGGVTFELPAMPKLARSGGSAT